MLASLILFFVVGLVTVIALTIVFALVGVVFSLVLGTVGFLLFKVLPILLIGWLILKLLRRSGPRRDIAAADRKWLDE
jgi:hypothetical protein